jgi:4-amino-4-deoxy-L-arabinose transferase-like glycosyltransferase
MTASAKTLLIILVVALILRLTASLSQDHSAVFTSMSSDQLWYLANGYALATGFEVGRMPSYPDNPISLRNLPTPPLYLLFVGLPQIIFSQQGGVIAVRVLQALLGAATCYYAYRLGRAISGDTRAGLIAAAVLAIAPAFVLETAQITTETLYIFLVTAALAIYVERTESRSLSALVLVAVLLGLATLTRAVLLLFPLGLAIHLLIIRAGFKPVALLLVVYTVVVGSWTVYSLARWDRFVIGGEGFAAFLYIGATDWEGPTQVDENLAQDAEIEGQLPPDTDTQQDLYRNAAANVISRDPLGYVLHRGSDLLDAYLLPHGTLLFGGAGLKELITDWLRTDRTLTGLIAVTQAPGFWPKLALYTFHYTGLVLGIIGICLTRRKWRLTLPLIGFILYTSLMHLLLDAIPRYIFPTMVCWWAFAGVTLAALWQIRAQRQQNQTPLTGTRQIPYQGS